MTEPQTTDSQEATSPVTPTPVVLIANVGSRNLSYHRKELREYYDSRNNPEYARWHFPVTNKFGRTNWYFDFRGVTEHLLTNYEEVKDDLSSEIFDYLLATDGKVDVHTVLLVASDQQGENHRHTDTLFEAELLKKLLLEAETVERVEILIASNVNPTHEAELFAFLAPQLQKFIRENAGVTVRFCDAGGTPQMKSVVKELLRYYLPAQQLDIRYLPNEEDAAAREVNSPLHEKYLLLSVARQFVQRYEYEGALAVLKPLGAETRPSQRLLHLLCLAAARLRFDRPTSLTTDQGSLPPVFDRFLQRKAPTGAVEFDELDDTHRYNIFEIASIAQLFLFDKKQLAPGILSFIRLIEELGQCLAEARGFASMQDRSAQRDFVTDTQQDVLREVPALRSVHGQVPYGIPYLVAYMCSEGSKALRLLAEEIKPAISHVNGSQNTGINLLRNRTFLTHENQGITAQDIQRHDRTPPGFLGSNGRASKIFGLLGMPAANIYSQMNAEILALFDQE